MSSMAPPAAGPVTVRQLRAAVAQYARAVELITGALGDPSRLGLGAIPSDVGAELAVVLLRKADQGVAAATVLAGHVTSTTGPGTGTLIAGTYASARRWLEVEAGLSVSSAKAVIARGKDLREHSAPVQEAWLEGEISGDKARELTAGVTGMLATVRTTRQEKARLREEAVQVLVPVARLGTTADLKRAVARLRLVAESAHEPGSQRAAQAAMEAYDDQRLSCVQVGDLFRLEAWLTPDSAAASMTVIDQYARRIVDRHPDVVHNPSCPLAAPPPPIVPGAPGLPATRWCSCGASAAAGVTSTDNWRHLLAVAFGELMTNHLDDGRVGSHHGIAPHVTVSVTLEQLHAGLGAELTLPGSDEPALLGSEAARRIMCDASITPVVVEKLLALEAAAGTDHLAQLLMSTAVAVLYVGRTQRTATPRQRRALEARDRHCVFPGCRAHPRRCQAHHVLEWENGGGTDLSNLALLCVRHHISVHEGGWSLTRTPGSGALETGCWSLAPPRPQP